jgi:hypothetical protein
MNKKAIKREYQQSQRPMGVFQIRCLANEKIFVGSSLNLPGILNREKFTRTRLCKQTGTLLVRPALPLKFWMNSRRVKTRPMITARI